MKKLIFLSIIFLQSCVSFEADTQTGGMFVNEITITSRYTANYEVYLTDIYGKTVKIFLIDTIGKYQIGEAITFTNAPKPIN